MSYLQSWRVTKQPNHIFQLYNNNVFVCLVVLFIDLDPKLDILVQIESSVIFSILQLNEIFEGGQGYHHEPSHLTASFFAVSKIV